MNIFGRNKLTQEQITMSLQKAEQLLQQGKLEEAGSLLKDALRSQPNNVEALSLCGMYDTLSGDYGSAVRHFRKAVELDPENSRAWFGLGLTYEEKGKKRQACEAFQQALAINPVFQPAAHKLVSDDVEVPSQLEKLLKPNEIYAWSAPLKFARGSDWHNDRLFFTNQRLVWNIHRKRFFNSDVTYDDMPYNTIQAYEKKNQDRRGALIAIRSTCGQPLFKLGDRSLRDVEVRLRRITGIAS